MLIGVVISGLVEEYTINYCKGIEQLSKEDNVQVIIIPGKYLDFDFDTELGNTFGHCFNSSFAYGTLSCFDGLIIEMASTTMFCTEENRAAFASHFEDIPHVFISYDDMKGTSNISLDNEIGLKDALEYLYDTNTRKFGMIGGPADNIDAQIRKNVFLDFLNNHNLPLNEYTYIDGDFFLDCSKQIKKLINNNPGLEAIICANDLIAANAYDVLKEFNLTPGKDISVLGFDDSSTATTIYPALSSIRTDLVELGYQSYKCLMNVIKENKHQNVKIPSKFILRDSFVTNNIIETNINNKPQFKDILKSNITLNDNDDIKVIEVIFNKIIDYIENVEHKDNSTISDDISELLEELFIANALDAIEINLFLIKIEQFFKEKYVNCESFNGKHNNTIAYMAMLQKLVRLTTVKAEGLSKLYIEKVVDTEAFFRESMHFTRNIEQNYARLLKNLSFLGINNAYMYMYKEPITYIKGEFMNLPDTLYLKAILEENNIAVVPKSRQEISINEIFTNLWISWTGYNRLTILPIYSEHKIYGFTLCDIKKSGYSSVEIFVNQINSAVKMLNLQIDNNRIVNEYEESVRKLKENNIVLDNMSKSDPLTGLNNRRGFYVRAESLMKSYPNDNEAILVGYIDMNNLKIINDRFGHDDGDFSLKSIGNILTDYVTNYNGFVARIGGDEFSFAFPCDNKFNEKKCINEIYSKFDEFNELSVKPYNVSVSIGTYKIKKNDNISLDDALNIADEYLYQEKILKKKDVLK